MAKKIDPEFKARAVRLVSDHLGEYSSLTAASAAVAKQLGVGSESVRRWVLQAQVDDGSRPGVTSEESAEIKKLKAENKRLREANEILKAPRFLRVSNEPGTWRMATSAKCEACFRVSFSRFQHQRTWEEQAEFVQG